MTRQFLWVGAIAVAFAIGVMLAPSRLSAQLPRIRSEFTHRQVAASEIDGVLGELDRDRWAIIQVAPVVYPPKTTLHNAVYPEWIVIAQRPTR
jgi:hypothetical protein